MLRYFFFKFKATSPNLICPNLLYESSSINYKYHIIFYKHFLNLHNRGKKRKGGGKEKNKNKEKEKIRHGSAIKRLHILEISNQCYKLLQA